MSTEALDKRITTSYWAAIRWMLIGLFLLLLSASLAFFSSRTGFFVTVALIFFLVGLFALWQSYRTVKLFYPGATLISAGIFLLFMAPVLQNFFWSLILLVGSIWFGQESGVVKDYLLPVSTFFAERVSDSNVLTGGDYFCGLVGIVLCILGVIAGKDGSVVGTIDDDDITNRATKL